MAPRFDPDAFVKGEVMRKKKRFPRELALFCLFGIFSLGLVSCTGGDPVPPPSVDLSGTWAGTWSGTDPVFGQVGGNWEAELTQTGYKVRAAMRLSGDVDCPDGSVAGAVGVNTVVSGTLSRGPCEHNEWTMTALSLLERSAGGVWTQPKTGSKGTFAGSLIATPGGPRIASLSPPAGLPGTIVTIVGSGFSPVASENKLDFNAIPVSGFLAADTTRLVVEVPAGAGTGPVFLTTPGGSAISPRHFVTKGAFPRAAQTATIPMPFSSSPEGIAFGTDGRRAYITTRGDGKICAINTVANQVLFSTSADESATVPVQGIVVSPDGRKVYVASGDRGVKVLDSITLSVVDTIPANAGGGDHPNPQGLAISPDGRLLFVSDNRDGGAVTVLDVSTKSAVAFITEGPGAIPLGIAVNPNGCEAYMAFNGPNVVKVFDIPGNTVTGEITAGPGVDGIAVSPDGKKAYVANESDNSVSVIDLVTRLTSTTVPVGSSPTGIAVSPDGKRAFVANRGSNSVSVIDLVASQTVTTVPAGSAPTGIVISPDGTQAYVTNHLGNTVNELGGLPTLSITKGGGGTGTVTSFPEGINCGQICRARYDQGAVVTLTATADSGSYFSGWNGD